MTTVSNTHSEIFNELCDYVQMFFKGGFKLEPTRISIGRKIMEDSNVKSLVEKLKSKQ